MLNPTNPNVYDVLGDIYGDLVDMFPSSNFHLGRDFTKKLWLHFCQCVIAVVFFFPHKGGDEVNFDCWMSSSEIQDYFDQEELDGDLEDYYGLWIGFLVRFAIPLPYLEKHII